MFRNSVGSCAAALLAMAATLPGHAQSAPRPQAAASSPLAQSPAPAVSASGAKPTVDAQRSTIGQITELAQQLKVEQLKRDLREARQQAAGEPGAAKAAAGGVTPAGLPPAATVVPVAAVAERAAPGVAAILGVGGRLRARLHDGREVVVGQEVQGWTVNAVTPSSVSFSHCAPPRKPGPKQDACVTRTVAPSAF